MSNIFRITEEENTRLKPYISHKNLFENRLKKQNSQILSQHIYRCRKCSLIPLINLNSDTEPPKFEISCQNGHSEEISLSEYVNNSLNNNFYNYCSFCRKNNDGKKRFKYCIECQSVLCKKCLSNHENTHNIISVKKMDFTCAYHKNEFTKYCKVCKKNLCNQCIHEKKHEILSFELIKPTILDLERIKDNLEIENKVIDNISLIFNKTIENLKIKFNNIITEKKQLTEFKQNIIFAYENIYSNYEVIENIKNLKFSNHRNKFTPIKSKNELDILSEIFNYLRRKESLDNPRKYFSKKNSISGKPFINKIDLSELNEKNKSMKKNQIKIKFRENKDNQEIKYLYKRKSSNKNLESKIEINNKICPTTFSELNNDSSNNKFSEQTEKQTDIISNEMQNDENINSNNSINIKDFQISENTPNDNYYNKEEIQPQNILQNTFDSSKKLFQKELLPKMIYRKVKNRFKKDHKIPIISTTMSRKELLSDLSGRNSLHTKTFSLIDQPSNLNNNAIFSPVHFIKYNISKMGEKRLSNVENNNNTEVLYPNTNINQYDEKLLKFNTSADLNTSNYKKKASSKKKLKLKIKIENKEPNLNYKENKEKIFFRLDKPTTLHNKTKSFTRDRSFKINPQKNTFDEVIINFNKKNNLATDVTNLSEYPELNTSNSVELGTPQNDIILNKPKIIQSIKRLKITTNEDAIMGKNISNNSINNLKLNSARLGIETNNKTILETNEKIFFDLKSIEKINSMKFSNSIICLVEIIISVFAVGDNMGEIKLFNLKSFNKLQCIKEHKNSINSLFLLHDKSILSSSSDKTMKKISFKLNYKKYNVDFIFNGYKNIINKGIELKYKYKILSISMDDKIFLWEEAKNNSYKNSLKLNCGDKVKDIIEFTDENFITLSNTEIKIWFSNNLTVKKSIKINNNKESPCSLCKINDIIVLGAFSQSIHIIHANEGKIINTIKIEGRNLNCIIKLNDNTILIAEGSEKNDYCLCFIRQYLYEKGDLKYLSYKKGKFYKTNDDNKKKVRVLYQFSNGILAEVINGSYKNKDCGDIFFFK